MTFDHFKHWKRCDQLLALVSCGIVLISCIDIVRYILLTQPVGGVLRAGAPAISGGDGTVLCAVLHDQ